MEIVELDGNGNTVAGLSANQYYLDEHGTFGNPKILSRVGYQYQADIPALIDRHDYVSSIKYPAYMENMEYTSDLLLGLPIPVMLIVDKCTEKMVEDNQIFSTVSINAASLDFGSVKEARAASDLRLVPASCGGSWDDIEKASFLLGLYIFGKNFFQLKKFVESKNMDDIQEFYYGKFYGSDKYKKWSKIRKRGGRNCVDSQRIFSGSRQKELLSRLVLHVSKECQHDILEVSKSFRDEKISLEDYVFILKAMVGIDIFIEVFGIGEGERDLICMAIEPVKSNRVSRSQKLPIGKAWSCLLPNEIINILTGGDRSSKSRSNDLFWEAVWPRLLARGWHSEQPYSEAALGAKNDLFFLIPGIEKFSKGKLEKGIHYYDSISDVLNKVCSEPALLDLDTEGDGHRKEENELANEQKVREVCSEWTYGCDVQPCTRSHVADVIKLTVVDTSMADGKLFKFRELKCLPMEIMKNGHGKSDVSTMESDSACSLLVEQESSYAMQTQTLSDGGTKFDRKVHNVSSSNPGFQVSDPDFTKPGWSSDWLSSTSAEKGSPPEGIIGTPDDCYSGPENPQDGLQPRIVIDLNFPPLDIESDVYVTDSPKIAEQHGNLGGPKTSVDVSTSVEQANFNSRRQSTRIRPPSARAVEAIVTGYSITNRRRKREQLEYETSTSRCPRRDRVQVGSSMVATTDAFIALEGETGMSNGGSNDMSDTARISNP